MTRKLNFLVIVLVAGLSLPCISAAASDPNLIAHWTFDEGTGTTAYDSVAANNGIINDANWIDGQVNGALSFDGINDYVDVSPAADLDFERTDAFTLSAWYKGDAAANTILSKMDAAASYRGYDMFIINGYISAHLISSWTSNAIREDGILYRVDDGIWHHIVMTYDGSSLADGLKIYVDAMEETTSIYRNSLSSTIQNSVSFKVAARSNGSGTTQHVNGAIDDVRIYNTALSTEQVEELYLASLADVVGLEITGPDEVAENFRAQYKAIAVYENDATTDVTDSAVWSLEPTTIASIDSNGLLTTKEISLPEAYITVYAQYTVDENTFEAEKAVWVIPICSTGSALHFDGQDDYVDAGTGPRFGFERTDAFTLSAWFKGSAENNTILSKMDKALRYRGYNIFIYKRFVIAQVISTWPSNSLNVWGTLHPVSDSAWHNIVATYDGSSLASGVKIYVDGMQETTSVSYDSLSSTIRNSVSLKIAARSDGAGTTQHLNGTIDNVAVWNTALTQEQIQAYMYEKPVGDESNLVAYWDFDEGNGQVVYDLTGNGNIGLLGTDPCNPDNSDPLWVAPDAPIGTCTPEALVERHITSALESKHTALEEIEAALSKENAAAYILEQLFRGRDYSRSQKNDIVKAKQEIHSAMHNEQRSTATLEKSVEGLEDSLSLLGYTTDPNDVNN